MPSGWTRFLLEQFEFPFEVVFPKTLDAGNLSSKFDVLIFPRATSCRRPRWRGGARGSGIPAADVPAEFRDQLGSITAAATVPQLKKFLEDGGTIVAVGRSAGTRAACWGCRFENHLVERTRQRRRRPLSRVRSTTCPGSILQGGASTRATPSPTAWRITWTCSSTTTRSIRSSPTRRSKASVRSPGSIRRRRLRSGWAYGQGYLAGGVVGIDAPVGKGRLFLFTPEITFRGQPHGTFKFLFNGIYLAGGQANGVADRARQADGRRRLSASAPSAFGLRRSRRSSGASWRSSGRRSCGAAVALRAVTRLILRAAFIRPALGTV